MNENYTILLSDDYLPKRDVIKNSIEDNTDNITLIFADSYQKTYEQIIFEKPSKIVLDISMPTFSYSNKEKGGTARSFAGLEILERMSYEKIEIPTILITNFKDFFDDIQIIKKSIEDIIEEIKIYHFCKGIIQYQFMEIGWQNELIEFINERDL